MVAQGFTVYIVGYQNLFQVSINTVAVRFRNITPIGLYSLFPFFCAVTVTLITCYIKWESSPCKVNPSWTK